MSGNIHSLHRDDTYLDVGDLAGQSTATNQVGMWHVFVSEGGLCVNADELSNGKDAALQRTRGGEQADPLLRRPECSLCFVVICPASWT